MVLSIKKSSNMQRKKNIKPREKDGKWSFKTIIDAILTVLKLINTIKDFL